MQIKGGGRSSLAWDAVWHQQEGGKGVLVRDLPSSSAVPQVEPVGRGSLISSSSAAGSSSWRRNSSAEATLTHTGVAFTSFSIPQTFFPQELIIIELKSTSFWKVGLFGVWCPPPLAHTSLVGSGLDEDCRVFSKCGDMHFYCAVCFHVVLCVTYFPVI